MTLKIETDHFPSFIMPRIRRAMPPFCHVPVLLLNPETLPRCLKRLKRPEDLGVDVRVIFEWILGKECGSAWIRFIWVKMGTGGGLL